VVRPDGSLLACTTDGHRQDYSDVGIVQMAMHPEEAAQAGEKGPAYHGYLRIDGGAYKGFYHGVARRLVMPGGAFAGAMLVANRLDDAQALQLRRQAMVRLRDSDPPAHVSLVSAKGITGSTLATRADRRVLESWLDGPQGAQARDTLLSQSRSQPFPLRVQGADQLVILARMNGANAQDLGMAELISVPLEPFLRPFSTIQRAILGAGLAGLALVLALALGMARRVTGPLGRLAKAAGLLAEGGRPEIPASRARDEVGQLTQAFCALLDELRAKEDLLAALEAVRAQADQGPEAPSRMSMNAVDVDATMLLPALPGAPGEVPALRAKKLVLREGEIFAGRYRIDSIVGRGGMGVVLRAFDQQLEEEVAIKVIRPELQLTPVFLEQLKQEIRLARRITHRHVLRTHDFGETDGIPFVSMEYLKGVTLRQLLDDRGSLPLSLILRIGRQTAEGLEAAHAVGVVHRDVKPHNVLFDSRGDAKLVDFGLAAPVAGRGTDTEGQIFGTPRYMAPEQVRGEHADPRTDLYAFGVMLYELCTGAPPYNHDSITELLRMQLQAPVPDVRTALPGLPEDLAVLVERLMAKRMEDRPGSAGEVAEILKLISSGSGETRRNA
jgi:serine/threonine-protein kinase